MFNKKLYQEVFSALHASEDTLMEAIKMTKNRKKPMKTLRMGLIAAAMACVLVMTAVAVVMSTPVLRDYFGMGGGYAQSGTLLGLSDTSEGWTLTLTDCVGDDRSLYLGLELIAPEGTVLDQEGQYKFDNWSISFPGLGPFGASHHYTLLPDEDTTDNLLRFAIWFDALPQDTALNGQRVRISFANLIHTTAWNEEAGIWDHAVDCQSAWAFDTVISYPDNIIRLEPDLPVVVLGVEARLSRVEISPISVYVVIEGAELKGHHSWTPRNAPDGYFGCVEYQEITIYTIDGAAFPLTQVHTGSGCSGGDEFDEPVYLHLIRKFDTLTDLARIERIEICGTSIPLS